MNDRQIQENSSQSERVIQLQGIVAIADEFYERSTHWPRKTIAPIALESSNRLAVYARTWALGVDSIDKFRFDFPDVQVIGEPVTDYYHAMSYIRYAALTKVQESELHRSESVLGLDEIPGSAFVQTKVQGLFFLVETTSRADGKLIDSMSLIGGRYIPRVPELNQEQKAVKALGFRVRKEDTGISVKTVHDVEQQFAVLEPKDERFDQLMNRYYKYLGIGLWNIAVTEQISYPLTFYDRDVTNESELIQSVLAVERAERVAVKQRGRDGQGNKGKHFWRTQSHAEDLEDFESSFNHFCQLLSFVAIRLQIDPEKFVDAMRGRSSSRIVI